MLHPCWWCHSPTVNVADPLMSLTCWWYYWPMLLTHWCHWSADDTTDPWCYWPTGVTDLLLILPTHDVTDPLVSLTCCWYDWPMLLTHWCHWPAVDTIDPLMSLTYCWYYWPIVVTDLLLILLTHWRHWPAVDTTNPLSLTHCWYYWPTDVRPTVDTTDPLMSLTCCWYHWPASNGTVTAAVDVDSRVRTAAGWGGRQV